MSLTSDLSMELLINLYRSVIYILCLIFNVVMRLLLFSYYVGH